MLATIGTTGLLVLGGTNAHQVGNQIVGGPAPGVNEKVKLAQDRNAQFDLGSKKVLIVVPGTDVVPQSASVTFDSTGAPLVNYSLNSAGSTAWCNYTTSHVNYFSPVVLDNKVIADPVIQSEICGGSTQVSRLTLDEANNLKTLLNYGALPVALHTTSTELVSATLGSEYIRKAEIAGIVGLILVALFMLVYYRLPGLLADIALLIYAECRFCALQVHSGHTYVARYRGLHSVDWYGG